MNPDTIGNMLLLFTLAQLQGELPQMTTLRYVVDLTPGDAQGGWYRYAPGDTQTPNNNSIVACANGRGNWLKCI